MKWLRALLFLVILGAVALGAGFLVFAQSVSTQSARALGVSPESLPDADGIAVWTGPGGRLQAGSELLKADKGERLLISGINATNTPEDILELLDLPPELNGSVDFDYRAIDTDTNAVETWAWVDALGYEHIILVTSAYHMPRARVTLGTQAGRIRVTPYPVGSADYSGWWRDAGMRDRLWREYAKLLVSYFRDPASEPSRDAPAIIIPED